MCLPLHIRDPGVTLNLGQVGVLVNHVAPGRHDVSESSRGAEHRFTETVLTTGHDGPHGWQGDHRRDHRSMRRQAGNHHSA